MVVEIVDSRVHEAIKNRKTNNQSVIEVRLESNSVVVGESRVLDEAKEQL